MRAASAGSRRRLAAFLTFTRPASIFTTRRLSVTGVEARLDPSVVIDTLQRLGYRAYPFDPGRAGDEDARRGKWLLMCLAVAGFAR